MVDFATLDQQTSRPPCHTPQSNGSVNWFTEAARDPAYGSAIDNIEPESRTMYINKTTSGFVTAIAAGVAVLSSSASAAQCTSRHTPQIRPALIQCSAILRQVDHSRCRNVSIVHLKSCLQSLYAPHKACLTRARKIMALGRQERAACRRYNRAHKAAGRVNRYGQRHRLSRHVTKHALRGVRRYHTGSLYKLNRSFRTFNRRTRYGYRTRYAPRYRTSYRKRYTPRYRTNYRKRYVPRYRTSYRKRYVPRYRTSYRKRYTPRYRTNYRRSYRTSYRTKYRTRRSYRGRRTTCRTGVCGAR